MALSFGKALLAGAAGVAEYSNEEQQRRQARMDRTQQLMDNMQIEQAKSKYATQYKAYERDQEVLKSLGSTDPNSVQGQMILMQAYNPGMEPALAFQMIQGGAKMKAPVKSDDIPVFDMPQFQRGGRAVSPIEDWFNGFTNAKARNLERAQAEYSKFQLQMESEQATTQPESQAMTIPTQAMGDYQPPGQETAGTLEPMGGAGKVPQADFDRDLQQLSGFFRPKADPIKYEVTKQDISVNGKKAKQVSFTDPNTGKTNTTIIPTNISAWGMIDPMVQETSSGAKVTTERFINPEDNTIILGTQYQSKAADPEAPVEPVRFEDIKQYMFKGDDKNSKGQFYGDFPETERDKWEGLGVDQGWAYFDATPEGFEQALAGAFLETKKSTSAKLLNKHVSNPKFMSELRDVQKATAYLKVLGADGVADAVKKGILDKELFYSPKMNKMKSIQQLQAQLGITQTEDPEEYMKLSKPKYGY